MKWPYKKGTRVKMSISGHSFYGSGEWNPVGLWGTVTYTSESGITEVKWDNGRSNLYRKGTLEPKPISLENK